MPIAEMVTPVIETLVEYGAIGVMIFGCYKIICRDNEEKKEDRDFYKELIKQLIDEKK